MDDLDKYTSYLGETVSVEIDRPLGSRHPKFGFIYEVNYGFIPNTKAGDGHEIDAWVLGVAEPVDTYTGQCIAVIVRHDDNENKLVISPVKLTPAEIYARIDFVEKHYKTELIIHDG